MLESSSVCFLSSQWCLIVSVNQHLHEIGMTWHLGRWSCIVEFKPLHTLQWCYVARQLGRSLNLQKCYIFLGEALDSFSVLYCCCHISFLLLMSGRKYLEVTFLLGSLLVFHDAKTSIEILFLPWYFAVHSDFKSVVSINICRYLERQDFLERTDLRQFQIEKELRTSRRSNRWIASVCSAVWYGVVRGGRDTSGGLLNCIIQND